MGDLADLNQLFRLKNWAIFTSLGLLLLSYLAGASRLVVLARLMGKRINFLRAVRAYILGLFSAAVTPSGSGNAIAIAFSLQRDGLKPPTAWSITIYTSVLDLLFFAWSAPLALLILGLTQKNSYSQLLLWVALPTGLLLLGLWYLLAFRLSWLNNFVATVFSLQFIKRWQRPALRFVKQLTVATATMTSGSLSSHLLLQLATMLLHLSGYAILFVFAVSLGAKLTLWSTLAIVLLVSILSYMIPTPGGSGYLEFAVSFMFVQQSSASIITPAVLAWRGFSYYLNLILGPLLGGPILAKSLSGSQLKDPSAD